MVKVVEFTGAQNVNLALTLSYPFRYIMLHTASFGAHKFESMACGVTVPPKKVY